MIHHEETERTENCKNDHTKLHLSVRSVSLWFSFFFDPDSTARNPSIALRFAKGFPRGTPDLGAIRA